jgi:UDP-N-acetylmuramyl pentapeptide phosphotransferase/UDP-N-acetylglucosamine-1-phosphate transferase
VVLGFVAFTATTLAVGLVRHHALRQGLLDVPNDRSSHSQPTPRGGGLGIVIVVVTLWAFAAIRWHAFAFASAACLAACVAIAGVGWIDDRRGLGVGVRLIIHCLGGAAVALLAVGSASLLESLSFWHLLVALSWLVWTVSSINVVNFMDGIDGLVASQAAIAMCTIAWLAPACGVSRPFALVVASACGGFLVWNWPPARVFLGDVGSGSLGFLLAVAGALLLRETHANPVRSFLPLLPLFLDAAWTMLRRVRNGEQLTVAHRSHLYQRLANGPWGHARVTLAFAAAAIPGALIATVSSTHLRAMLCVAYAMTLLVVGRRLDHSVPFAWRSRDAGSEPLGVSPARPVPSQHDGAL